jgi:serine protease AprX
MKLLVRMALRGTAFPALSALGFAAAATAASAAGPALPSESVKVWVSLADKGPGSLSLAHASRAYEDLPVYDPYVQTLKANGLACDTRLKWQNMVSGRIAAGRMGALEKLAIVTKMTPLPRKARPAPPAPSLPLSWMPGLKKSAAGAFDYGFGRALVESLHVDKVHAFFANAGEKPGLGMRIAIIDADFSLGSPLFKNLFDRNRILDQWDFVHNKPVAVAEELAKGSHGGECMSLIAGNLPGTLVGMAPEASFLLYRSEDTANEGFVEEDYVAAAIERAVDSGAQVISISLGYRYEYDDGNSDLPYASLDGRTRPSSIAATMAARRNVVVSVAMGNLPAPNHIPSTPSISAPADADSILAVGIADRTRRKCSYSCTGPSADGRVKPDVASMGVVGGCSVSVANTSSDTGGVEALQGTSFAAPVVAGIAALLRQSQPGLSAEAIRQALISTADRVSHPDSGLGNGLVDAWAAFRKINGDTLAPVASPENWIRIYHAGGRDPLFIPRNFGDPLPRLDLADLSGRRIAVTVSIFGPTVLIRPEHDLRTGVYIARIR